MVYLEQWKYPSEIVILLLPNLTEKCRFAFSGNLLHCVTWHIYHFSICYNRIFKKKTLRTDNNNVDVENTFTCTMPASTSPFW